MNDTTSVAKRLVEMCRQGQFEEALTELYGSNVVSIEPDGIPNNKVEGIDAVVAKSKEWVENTEEIFGMEVSDPIVADDHFAITMKVDVKQKGMPRMKMEEVCVYKVENGKVTSEQFHYSMPPMD